MSNGSSTYSELISKLDEFIRRFYKNQLIKGTIYSLALLLSYFLLTVLVDFVGEFETTLRTVLFYGLILASTATVVKFLLVPGAKLFNMGDGLSHDEAAKIIGSHFSSVQDKLLNVLQLKQLSDTNNSELLYASIDQKVMEINPVPFAAEIDFSENKKYLRFALPPVFVLLLLFIVTPNILKQGTERLVNHTQHFAPTAPFTFTISNESLSAIKGENFTINVSVNGQELPNNAFVEINGSQFRLKKVSKTEFSYTIKNIQENTDFRITADGFYSEAQQINVVPQPLLLGFNIKLNYPKYIKRENSSLNNTGDMVVPEGTEAVWTFTTKDADKLRLTFADTSFVVEQSAKGTYKYVERIRKSNNYFVSTSNEFMRSKDSVMYSISVVPDQYPSIEVEEQVDSLSSKRIYFRGNIKDDYGLSKMTFNYKFNGSDSVSPKELIVEPILVNKTTQDYFFHYWDISDLPVSAGDQIEYYFEVWDNDGINGSKSTKSTKMIFKAPTLDQLAEQNDKSSEEIKEKLEESLKDAKEIQEDLEKFQKKLLEKKELSWEDKKRLEELLEKQKKLEKNIEKVKQENQQMQNEQSEYKEQEERIVEKQKQIQELFEQVMTDEMKEMFKELEEMMEKLNKEELQEKLQEMKLTNKDIEKELDRTLETFKQMEFEMKLEETIEKLDELAKEQKELAEETKEKDADKEDLKEKQQEIKEKFEELQKDMDELAEKNEELENSHKMPDTEQEEQEAKKQMEESSEELSEGKKKKASESQQSAGDEMQKMSEKLQNMQQEMQEKQAEDIEALRQLRDNLIALSFDQEQLMKEVKTIKNHSPYYVELIQRQKKLSDDAKMVEDSLFALSKRQPKIRSVVNREMTQINENIEKSIDLLSNHNPPKRFNQYIAEAAGREQYIMTSLNNLALMLDEAIQQMQQQMSEQKFGDKSCSKPGNSSQPKPGSMKKMQKSLSKQMEQLKKEMEAGKKPGQKPNGSSPGGGMSKKLAELAAQQEALRNEVQKIADKMGREGENEGEGEGKGGKGNLEKLAEMMEENEKDIVNKNITQETIRRQRDIMTRLLEHEKAEREREFDEKRQSQEAKNQEISNPSEFFEYNIMKQKEAELLRTVPPTMNSFYKNKVNEYFNQVE
ncbi:MAG: hypothetical protein JKY53_04045 [Flavobacteriales bacterium]|nr:hypothetical protein [Flavobacteriales bacterium]